MIGHEDGAGLAFEVFETFEGQTTTGEDEDCSGTASDEPVRRGALRRQRKSEPDRREGQSQEKHDPGREQHRAALGWRGIPAGGGAHRSRMTTLRR